MKKAQISFEYLMLMSFVAVVILGIMAVAFFYTGTSDDRMRMNQLNRFAEKVISTAEYVFYSGEPSKATIAIYLPEGVNNIQITENMLVVNITTSSGENRIGFPANVNITGTITPTSGIKNLEISAKSDHVEIVQA